MADEFEPPNWDSGFFRKIQACIEFYAYEEFRKRLQLARTRDDIDTLFVHASKITAWAVAEMATWHGLAIYYGAKGDEALQVKCEGFRATFYDKFLELDQTIEIARGLAKQEKGYEKRVVSYRPYYAQGSKTKVTTFYLRLVNYFDPNFVDPQSHIKNDFDPQKEWNAVEINNIELRTIPEEQILKDYPLVKSGDLLLTYESNLLSYNGSIRLLKVNSFLGKLKYVRTALEEKTALLSETFEITDLPQRAIGISYFLFGLKIIRASILWFYDHRPIKVNPGGFFKHYCITRKAMNSLYVLLRQFANRFREEMVIATNNFDEKFETYWSAVIAGTAPVNSPFLRAKVAPYATYLSCLKSTWIELVEFYKSVGVKFEITFTDVYFTKLELFYNPNARLTSRSARKLFQEDEVEVTAATATPVMRDWMDVETALTTPAPAVPATGTSSPYNVRFASDSNPSVRRSLNSELVNAFNEELKKRAEEEEIRLNVETLKNAEESMETIFDEDEDEVDNTETTLFPDDESLEGGSKKQRLGSNLRICHRCKKKVRPGY